MKNIKIYENFDEQEIGRVRKYTMQWGIEKFKLNANNSINVDENVRLTTKSYGKIKIKFNKINGNFYCNSNHLKTLENSPSYVKKNFNCSNNLLTTLIEGPKFVGGNYDCYNNNLKDIYGLPDTYNGIFTAFGNPINEILTLASSKLYGITQRNNKYLTFIHLLNDYNVIRNGNTIIKDRLEEAIAGINEPYNIDNFNYYINNFEHYKLI